LEWLQTAELQAKILQARPEGDAKDALEAGGSLSDVRWLSS
jgi:hypothetical protein